MSRIVIRNKTIYRDDVVRELVRFAFSELELPSRFSIVVRVNHTRISEDRRRSPAYMYGASGHAYPYAFNRPDRPKNAAWETHLRVGRPEDFPVDWYDRGYEGVHVGILNDFREALICIAAHEGKHIETYQLNGRRMTRRAMGHTKRDEEARCDAFAAAMLNRYRKESHDGRA